MIHMKSLIRRLDCVPWLLTIGLVLGWAGESMAQVPAGYSIRLSLDEPEVRIREGAGKATVKVTATIIAIDGSLVTGDAAKKAPKDGLHVQLSFSPQTGTGATTADLTLRDHYRVGGASTITIEENTASNSAAVEITPLEANGAGNLVDIFLAIGGDLIGAAGEVTNVAIPPTATGSSLTGDPSTIIRIVDNDKPSDSVYLKVSPTKIVQGAGATPVKVEAFLDGATLTDHAVEIELLPVSPRAVPDNIAGDAINTVGPAPTAVLSAENIAARDGQFDLSGTPKITIPKDSYTNDTMLTITPRHKADMYIVLRGNVAVPGVEGKTLAENIFAAAAGLGPGAGVPANETFFGLGAAGDAAVNEQYTIFLSKEDPPAVKKVTGYPAFIRESDVDGGDIELTIELSSDVSGSQTVTFDIEQVTGRRDVDYDLEIDPVEITSGKTVKTTLKVIPLRDITKDLSFKVTGKIDVADTDSEAFTVTIKDDKTRSENILLESDVEEIYEGDGETTVTIKALLDGAPLEEDLTVSLQPRAVGAKDPAGSTARRDVDYDAAILTLTIKAGQTQGVKDISITPKTDKDDSDGEKKGETIVLEDIDGAAGKTDPLAKFKYSDNKEIAVGRVTITLKNGDDPAKAAKDDEDAEPALALVDEETALTGTVGMDFTIKTLPEVTGTSVDEDSEVDYLLSGTLPAGLAFDADDRTISGTPTTAGESEIEYIALVNGTNVRKTYTFTIAAEAEPTFNVESVSADRHLLRENAGHATTITLTVTLAEPAATDTKVTLDFAGPNEGKTANRDEQFTAQWDADYGRIVSIAKDGTTGMAKVAVTPTNNEMEGATFFTVQATPTNGSGAKSKAIEIADDESSSDAILLSVDPATVYENDGSVSVTVTATLAGGKLDEDVTVTVGISGGSAARDEDYTANFESTQITIASDASPLSGSTTVTVTPVADEKDETGEVIELTGMATDLATGSAVIALKDGGGMADDGDMDGEGGEGEGEGEDGDMAGDDDGDGMMAGLHFTEAVEDQAYTAGTAIADLVLPEAVGGEGDVTYRVFDLPAGLAFDDSTRTISGTPEAATDGAVEVTVLAQDSADAATTLTFNVTVNAALSFGDLFGAGKIVPDSHGLMTEIREFVIGQPVEGITLPEGAGGTAPLTYSLSPALPAGLTFDAVTRTIAGTPTAASETVYTYTVTDANGASVSLALQTLPAAFSLANNFPNPFNPATTIKYALPQATDVELTVYNVLGQPVRTLVAEHQNAGRYVVEWDATNDSGHSLSSGMYLYRLQAGGEFREVKKMLLLK